MIKIEKQKDKGIKVRRKGNSYEARKTIDLSLIYGYEVKKRISKTALTEDKAIALLKIKERDEILKAVEDAKGGGNKYKNRIANGNIENYNGDFTIKSFIDIMLRNKKAQVENTSNNSSRKNEPKTFTYYRNTAKGVVTSVFGNLDIRKLTIDELQQYFDEFDYKPKYLNHIKLVMKLIFQTAIKLGVIEDNIASEIKIGKQLSNVTEEEKYLNKERQSVWLDLFEQDGRQWAYLLEAILLSGVRPEERMSDSNSNQLA